MTRYKWAIRWLAANDDCYWVTDPNGCMSVTASFVSDLFDKDDKAVIADLTKELKRIKHPAVAEVA